MIDFVCPKCGEQMSVPDSQIGRKEICRNCGSVAVVPDKPTTTDVMMLDVLRAILGEIRWITIWIKLAVALAIIVFIIVIASSC